MKRILAFIILLAAATVLQAQTPEQILQSANKSYESKDYTSAIASYESLVGEGFSSLELYYNLGNAYYRTGNMAKAILNYEKALKISPKDVDTRENLELANSKIQDKIDTLPELFVTRWIQSIQQWMTPAGWIILSIILFGLLLTALVIVFIGQDYSLRKYALIAAAILTLAGIFSIVNATITKHNVLIHDEAIVMPTMISVKSSPEAGSVEKFVLHSGTKVAIDDEVNGWLKISIADGNKGWLNETEIERI